MTVRLLGLNCSPRDNSNSSIMLERAFEKLDATYPGEAEHEVFAALVMAVLAGARPGGKGWEVTHDWSGQKRSVVALDNAKINHRGTEITE